MGASAMADETRYTLYSQQSFELAAVPDDMDLNDFWDDLRDKLAQQGGSLVIYPEATGRILRVVYTENAVWTAYHFGVHQGRQSRTIKIRLQPQTAWHERLGRPDQIEPVLASTARLRLDEIETLLTNAANETLGE
jgi:hypothetical protein